MSFSNQNSASVIQELDYILNSKDSYKSLIEESLRNNCQEAEQLQIMQERIEQLISTIKNEVSLSDDTELIETTLASKCAEQREELDRVFDEFIEATNQRIKKTAILVDANHRKTSLIKEMVDYILDNSENTTKQTEVISNKLSEIEKERAEICKKKSELNKKIDELKINRCATFGCIDVDETKVIV